MAIYSRNHFANRLFIVAIKMYSHLVLFISAVISETISSLFRVLICQFSVSMFFLKHFQFFVINEQDDLAHKIFV